MPPKTATSRDYCYSNMFYMRKVQGRSYERNVLVIKVDGVPLNSNLFDSCMFRVECYAFFWLCMKTFKREIGKIPAEPLYTITFVK